MSLERQFHRKHRVSTGEKHPKVLDAFNDRQDMKEKYLHGRKGYRKFSVKRSKAAMITAEQKQGKFPPSIFAWKQIKEILQADRPA